MRNIVFSSINPNCRHFFNDRLVANNTILYFALLALADSCYHFDAQAGKDEISHGKVRQLNQRYDAEAEEKLQNAAGGHWNQKKHDI